MPATADWYREQRIAADHRHRIEDEIEKQVPFEASAERLMVVPGLGKVGVWRIFSSPASINLKEFSEAIISIYPKAEVQSCIVHQIRNSLKYVTSKNQKEFMRDLKQVYCGDTKEMAAMELENLAEKWESKYPLSSNPGKTIGIS